MTPTLVVRIDSDVLDLAQDFLEHRRRSIPNARAALAAGDWDLLRRLGHELKGTAGSYGFSDLSAVGVELEEAAVMEDPDTAADAVERIANYLEWVIITARNSSS
jgi:HPt (histidine-containing phosphotransfer) domain-containing protein